MQALLLFLKYPEPGRVKTRLARDLGDEQAVEVYRESVRMVLEKADGVTPDAETVLFISPGEALEAMREEFQFQGRVEAQTGADLGERLWNGARWAFGAGYESVVFLGGDSPTLPAEYLTQALDAAREALAIGPAEDGGYWTLGMPCLEEDLFRDIDWGTARVFEQTLERAAERDLSTRVLPQWYDIDTVDDLQRAIQDPGGERLGRILSRETGRRETSTK